jgi:hypothetical protein
MSNAWKPMMYRKNMVLENDYDEIFSTAQEVNVEHKFVLEGNKIFGCEGTLDVVEYILSAYCYQQVETENELHEGIDRHKIQ